MQLALQAYFSPADDKADYCYLITLTNKVLDKFDSLFKDLRFLKNIKTQSFVSQSVCCALSTETGIPDAVHLVDVSVLNFLKPYFPFPADAVVIPDQDTEEIYSSPVYGVKYYVCDSGFQFKTDNTYSSLGIYPKNIKTLRKYLHQFQLATTLGKWVYLNDCFTPIE